MQWIIELEEDCNYEDHIKQIEGHILDDTQTAFALSIVNSFIERFPTVPIDTVHLTVNQDGSVSTEINKDKSDPTEIRLSFEKKVLMETGLAVMYYHQQMNRGLPEPIQVGDYYVTINVNKWNKS